MPQDSSGSAEAREARLAKALRANLGRRKAQARAKKAGSSEQDDPAAAGNTDTGAPAITVGDGSPE